MLRTILVTIPLVVSSTPGNAFADDVSGNVLSEESLDVQLNDEWDFVADENVSMTPEVTASPFALTGFFRSEEGFWIERLGSEPLAKARQSLDLQATFRHGVWSAAVAVHGEYDAAYLVERSRLDAATLDAYEWLIDLRRGWVSAELGAVDVAAGLQVLNWGEGDALSLADLTNPRDLREPGLADLEDLRLPALMTRIGWFSGRHRVEIAWIHEGFFGYRTPPMGPFSPLPAILDDASSFDIAALLEDRELAFAHRQRRFSWDTQQWFGRWSWRGEGVDLAVFGGLALDHQGVVLMPSAEALLAGPIVIGLDHHRFGVAGLSGARPVGDWLLKWELVFQFGRPWNTLTTLDSGLPDVGVQRSSSFGGMLGIQYAGIADTIIALEMAQTLPFETDAPFIITPDVPQVALRVQHRALRDSLSFLAAVTSFGWRAELGWVGRAEVGWRVVDGIELGLGWIHYAPSEQSGPISGLDSHDRVSLKFRWDFRVL